MSALSQETRAYRKLLATPPPPGSPYAVPVPGSERPGRSAVYRHWRFQNGPLLERFDESEQTFHDLFENSVARYPRQRCMGTRPWNPTTKTYDPKFTWLTYAEVAERRKNLGAGIVELHNRIRF